MGGHDGGQCRAQSQKRQQIRLEQLPFIQVNHGKAEMGIRQGTAHAGKMFAAALHAAPAQVGGINAAA